jgi:hypothetical protein
MNLNNIEFLDKIYFFLVLLIPIFLYFYFRKQEKIQFIFFKELKKIFKKHNIFFYLKAIFVSFILFLMIVIIANPNIANTQEKIKKN